MKKIVLLGDSIRLIGYGERLAALLSDEYEVWQPEDNCRWADYTYRMLSDKASDIEGADIIHWNNGHWDMCNLFGEGSFTSLENYISAMKRLATRLKSIAGKVIFSTTTPVTPRLSYSNNEVIERYNAAIVPMLSEMGIIVNDLYSFVRPHVEEYIKEDNIHLNELGSEECAKQIYEFIKKNA